MAAVQLPLTLDLHSSRRLAQLLIAAHGGALLCVLSARPFSFDGWVVTLSVVALAISLIRELWRIWGRRRIVHLILRADGTLAGERADGRSLSWQVMQRTTVTPWLLLLWLRGPQGQSEVLTLLPDALAFDDLRRLRIWLRWRAKTV